MSELIEKLNQALGLELRAINLYAHYAAYVKGLNRIQLEPMFQKEANESMVHAATIRNAIVKHGGECVTQRDQMGISENLWNWMMGPLAVKSMLDIGCGKGVSTEYFHRHGAQVLCVEGSHDAVTQSLLPTENIVEHDFSRGPWWPENTYDIAW